MQNLTRNWRIEIRKSHRINFIVHMYHVHHYSEPFFSITCINHQFNEPHKPWKRKFFAGICDCKFFNRLTATLSLFYKYLELKYPKDFPLNFDRDYEITIKVFLCLSSSTRIFWNSKHALS